MPTIVQTSSLTDPICYGAYLVFDTWRKGEVNISSWFGFMSRVLAFKTIEHVLVAQLWFYPLGNHARKRQSMTTALKMAGVLWFLPVLPAGWWGATESHWYKIAPWTSYLVLASSLKASSSPPNPTVWKFLNDLLDFLGPHMRISWTIFDSCHYFIEVLNCWRQTSEPTDSSNSGTPVRESTLRWMIVGNI